MRRCLSAARVLFRNRTRPLKIYAACIYHDLPDSAVHFFPLRIHFFVTDYAHSGRSSILINFPTEILSINFVLRRHYYLAPSMPQHWSVYLKISKMTFERLIQTHQPRDSSEDNFPHLNRRRRSNSALSPWNRALFLHTHTSGNPSTTKSRLRSGFRKR